MISRIKRRYNQLADPARASIWFVICIILQRGIQFLTMPVYTRIMTQSEYGLYSVFLSWFNIVVIISSLNIHTGTFTKGLVKFESDRDSYVSSMQSLTTIVTLLLGVLGFVFSPYIHRLTGFSTRVQIFMLMHLVSYPVFQFWSLNERSMYRYKKLIMVTFLNSIISFVCGVIVVFFTDDKSTALIGATVLVQFALCLILFLYQKRRSNNWFDKEFWLWTVGLSVPLIPHALSEIILNHSDRIMIGYLCGTSQTAIYTVVYQISMTMSVLRGGVNGAYTPWLYYSIRDKKYENIRNVTNVLTTFMGLLSAILMLAGPEILKVVAPKSYYEAVVDIPSIMIGCHFVFVYLLFSNVEIYYEYKKGTVIASVCSAVINVALNYFLIPVFGYLVAGYTTMISYSIMAGLHLLFMKRIENNYPEVKSIFDIGYIMKSSAGLIAFGIISYYLYDYVLIRGIVMGVLSLYLFIKRHDIRRVLYGFNVKGD